MTVPPELLAAVSAHYVTWFELAGARGPGDVAARLKAQSRGYTGTGPDGAPLAYWAESSGITAYRGGWGIDPVRLTHAAVARWAWARLDEHDRERLAAVRAERGEAVRVLWDEPAHEKYLRVPNTLTEAERAHLRALDGARVAAERELREIVAAAFGTAVSGEPLQLALFT